MSIGYACVHIGSEKTKLSALRLSNASLSKLRITVSKNLEALDEIIKYNIKNKIFLYRISSDIIPLGSHPANKLNWKFEFKSQLDSIGKQILETGMVFTVEPGLYFPEKGWGLRLEDIVAVHHDGSVENLTKHPKNLVLTLKQWGQ